MIILQLFAGVILGLLLAGTGLGAFYVLAPWWAYVTHRRARRRYLKSVLQ